MQRCPPDSPITSRNCCPWWRRARSRRGRHGAAAGPATSASAASGGATTAASREPLLGLVTADEFNGQTIYRADVAATGPASPMPPGILRDPGPASSTLPPHSANYCAVLRRTNWRTVTPALGGPHRHGGPSDPRLAGHRGRALRRVDVAPARRRGGDQPQHHFA